MSPTATVWAESPTQARGCEGKTAPDAEDAVYERAQPYQRSSRRGWGAVIDRLQSLLALEDDWDGGGARRPAPATIRYCVALARRWANDDITPPSSVSPTLEGGVVFQWQEEGTRMEAEVNEPGRAECMLSVRGQKPKHWVIR
jgi:hypothetical protein